ncbi:BAG domain protein [Akanthomyces lecanii RCEF 1005]|uniref:BAG domain protein n=1 Tax=Akanthomyces lecanii RCEF 1005 TaxID=1081108 RepID=A0A168G1W7_CORDF|nr:BAG domain protein [Akanthomyces lecanii RCEF 1005]
MRPDLPDDPTYIQSTRLHLPLPRLLPNPAPAVANPRRIHTLSHEKLYDGRVTPPAVPGLSSCGSSQNALPLSLPKHHTTSPPHRTPSRDQQNIYPTKVSSRKATLPPIDKVDSTRAAVASPGALQNIGSYITGTLDSLSATLDTSNQYISTTLGLHPSLVYTAAAALVAVPVTMSRYGWSRSPYGSQPGGVPTVTEDDYAYITSQDLDDHGLGSASSNNARRPHSPSADDDVLLIKSRGVNYPTHFPRHVIGDGKLKVSDVAERAGLMMGLPPREWRYLKFLYKGLQLKDQTAPVRDYGVRNNSVLMAILPEGNGRVDASDEEMVVVGESKSQRKNKKRKAAKKRNAGDGDSATSPGDSTSGGAKSPSPVPGAAGQRRIDEIANDFKTKWLPMCKEYINKPPADARKRTDEHTRLSETILQHVVLKLDEVDTEGNPDVRQSRKDLIRTVQDVLKQVDVARGPVDR